MGALGVVLAVLGAWLVAAVLLAVGIGRAARIGETKYRDEVFLRDLARESAKLAEELDQGLLQELAYIRSRSAALAQAVPEAEDIVLAADRALAEANAAVRALSSSRP